MPNVRVFLCYDREHDEDLVEKVLGFADAGASGFEIVARSHPRGAGDPWDHELRRAVRETDEMLVLCGEHTDESVRVSAELQIAQEEERPYMLLWARREVMCKKPISAKPDDAMYGLSLEIIQQQMLLLQRAAVAAELLARKQLEKELEKAAQAG